jgi:hypothetical protein
MSKQPEWEYLGNLGDASPLLHGGYFVYRDKTGVYDPQAELLVVENEDDAPEEMRYTVYRFDLPQCTYVEGVLSDNPYHPECSAWFYATEAEKKARPQDSNLDDLASSMGIEVDELIRLFCSDDPLERAEAWRMVGDYHGFENLDEYPMGFSREEIEQRYEDGELKRRK